MSDKGTLVFFCGKMGAGKSTLAKSKAVDMRAVLLSEDDWLAALYPEEINSFEDYLRYSTRLKPVLKPHIQSILLSGTSVVLDFPANTEKQRRWFKDLATEIDAPHSLIFINVSDQRCLKQIAKRREQQPERAAFDTEEMFRHVTRYFKAPSEQEELCVVELGND